MSLIAPEPVAPVPNSAATQPLVSAIIPTYNRGCVIERAITSALRQTYRPIEIIIADDGSTDDTRARVSRLSGSSLRYCRSETNCGVSAARNLGIAHAHGELIAFLDADDEWLPDKTSRQVARFADSSERPGLVYCGIRELSSGWPPMDRLPRERGHIFEKLRVTNVLRTSGVMVRRDVLDDIGGFDTTLPACEDWDLWLKIARKHPVEYISDIAVHYYWGNPDQLSYRSRAVFLANAAIYKRTNGNTRSRAALGTHLALQARELLSLGKHRRAAAYATRALRLQPFQPLARQVLKQLAKRLLAGDP